MSKNSTNLSKQMFATHNCNRDTLRVGFIHTGQCWDFDKEETKKLWLFLREEFNDLPGLSAEA